MKKFLESNIKKTLIKNRLKILGLLFVFLFSCTKDRYAIKVSKNNYHFERLNCLTFDDLNLSSRQRRQISVGANKFFGEKENLNLFCYKYRVGGKGIGLVEAFDFSSHPSNFLFLISEKRIKVLQSEPGKISLMSSFKQNVRYYSKEFNPDLILEMEKYLSEFNYMSKP